ncbi:histidine phosphatase superfamily [Panaeolus papilionaceus]|nr:histidine phosphatase superfamily [Panaeolus papilionaceus]
MPILSKDGAANLGAYGYRPPQVDVEGYQIPPEGLKLKQVHVYVRHGERTPVGVRMTNAPANIPEHWNMCKTASRFRSAVHTTFSSSNTNQADLMASDEAMPTRIAVERGDGNVVEGECLLGELTDLGRQTTLNFGQNLRKLYVERLGFIPDKLSDTSQVYFRTTNIPRTTQSLQQIVRGLYPDEKCHENVYPPSSNRNGKDENLIGNTYTCKRLEILQVSFAKAAAEAYNHTLERLDNKLSKYIDGNPIRVDGKPRASGIMDTIRAAVAHGIKVPPEFEDKHIVDTIEKAVVTEWFSGCKTPFLVRRLVLKSPSSLDKTEEVRRLGMGRLLADISKKMEKKVQKGDSDPLKILVHSTHDTAIAALCSTLDVFDEQWPAFTASITFELFEKPKFDNNAQQAQSILSRLGTGSQSEHFVRMRYQNKDMALPICAEQGKHLEGHPEFCTFEAFKTRVKELIPTEWDVECSPAGRP